MANAPVARDDLERFGSDVTRAIQQAFQSAVGGQPTRDLGPDVARPEPAPTPAPAPTTQEQPVVRFWGTLISAAISLAPTIIDQFREQNRDIVIASRDPQQVERDLLGVISAIIQNLGPIANTVFDQLQNREVRTVEEANRGFFDFVQSVAPHVIRIGTAVAQALSNRRDLGTRAYDPEVATRILPVTFSSFGPVFSCFPQLYTAVTGRQLPQ